MTPAVSSATPAERLLELHPKLAASANVAAAKLIDWMMTFQFDGDVDYFTLDPVAYAPVLGEAGMIAYRARLAQIGAGLGPRPSEADRWRSQHLALAFDGVSEGGSCT